MSDQTEDLISALVKAQMPSQEADWTAEHDAPPRSRYGDGLVEATHGLG
jgi:hypothetical protein